MPASRGRRAFQIEPADALEAGRQQFIAAVAVEVGDEDAVQDGECFVDLRDRCLALRKLRWNGQRPEMGRLGVACAFGALGEQRGVNQLPAAIAVWRRLLLFDPDNARIKKSIESATAQLNKIKSSGY